MKVRLKAHGASDIGLVRANNEDAWYSSPQDFLFVIADGLGGHQSGEVASKEAIDCFVQAFRKKYASEDHSKTHVALFQEACIETNSFLYQLSSSHELLKGMGTTLVALHLDKNGAVICHVGDSRLYRFRKKDRCLVRMTTDHLVAYNRNDFGKKERAVLHKGYLTRAIGTQHEVMPDVFTSDIQIGDIFLMCTDGLSDMVSDDEIEKALAIPLTVEQKVRMLISIAKEKGGIDNITVLLIEILQE